MNIARLPKTVKLVVHDGRNLDYRVTGSKKSPKTRRWRVIFIGDDKKQATGVVDAQDGFPRWDCEVTITTTKPIDAIRMLVIDGKERHVGQIVIPLMEITATSAPSLVTSNLHLRELEPTKRNPTPCGQISFWIWVVEFWPEGTIVSSSHSLSKSRSFKDSISQMGAAIKSHGSLISKDDRERGEGASRLGKLRNLKRSRQHNGNSVIDVNDGAGSIMSSYSLAGAQDIRESIISGSRPLGWSSEIGGNSALDNGIDEPFQTANLSSNIPISYNPFGATGEDGRQLEAQPRRTTSTMMLSQDRSNIQSYLNKNIGETPEKGDGHKKGVMNRLKSRVSRSTANLSEIGHKMKSRKSLQPDSQRNSTISGYNETPNTEIDPDGSPPHQPRQIFRPNLIPSAPNDATSVKQRLSGPAEPSAWGLPDASMGFTGSKPPLTSSSGMHPEERLGKPKTDMSKRELVDLTNLLEQRLLSTRAELVRVNIEQQELHTKIDDLNSELTSTRQQLSDLRNHLLADNMTKYLEVNSSSKSLNMSTMNGADQLPFRGDFGTVNRLDNKKNISPSTANNSPSLISRAKAFASKPFTSYTSQPSIPNAQENHLW